MLRRIGIIVAARIGIGFWLGMLVTPCGAQAPSAASTTQSAPTGSISGTVQTADGKPVMQAVVAISSRPAHGGGAFTRFRTTVLTGANGTFTLGGLADGTYAVCPRVPRSTLIAPCDWMGDITATISGGNAVTIPTIQLQPSADFYVLVNDPNGVRAASDGKVPGAALILGVRNLAGKFIPIPITKSTSTAYDQHLPVPTGVNLPFIVYSGFYNLSDATGLAINQSTALPQTINIPAGQAQYKTTINIQ
jgi:hypothetical protein